MKKNLMFLTFMLTGCFVFSQTGSIGIGTTTPNTSAAVDIQNTSKGILIPRMTTAQRNAIASPATGLLVFDNTTGSFWFKSSGNWVELVDTLNTVWKKNGDDAYAGMNGNLGIGKTDPAHKLSVNGSFGLYAGNNIIGTISGNSNDLLMNARLGNTVAQTNPHNILLQYENEIFSTSGNVGIGTSAPDIKLHIDGGTDASGAGGGYLQLGSTASLNIGFDENEIQARNNGVANKLFLQASGGDLQIGGTNNIIINDGYQVYRNRPLSTNADLLPIAYAKVNGFTPEVLSGTGNFTVQRLAEGEYRLLLLGESNLYANKDLYNIFITIEADGLVPVTANYEIRNDNSIRVYTARSWVNFSNTGCAPSDCPVTSSYIENINFDKPIDARFSILIYKM